MACWAGSSPPLPVGRFRLRRTEEFLADLGVGVRRALGLGHRSPSDSTLYRLLAGQDSAGLEEAVFA